MANGDWVWLNPLANHKGLVEAKGRFEDDPERDRFLTTYNNPFNALFFNDGAMKLFDVEGHNREFRKHGKCLFFVCALRGSQDIFVMLNKETVHVVNRALFQGAQLADIPTSTLRKACDTGSMSIPAEAYREWCLNVDGRESKSGHDEDGGDGEAKSQMLQQEREWRLQLIRSRPGQGRFRDGLLVAYGNRCAITGCDAAETLEAAHIRPYHESQCDELTNGLLLRADIHTLFDLDLIGIELSPDNRCTVCLSPALKGTSYAELEGRQLVEPTASVMRPCRTVLGEKWHSFQQLNPTKK